MSSTSERAFIHCRHLAPGRPGCSVLCHTSRSSPDHEYTARQIFSPSPSRSSIMCPPVSHKSEIFWIFWIFSIKQCVLGLSALDLALAWWWKIENWNQEPEKLELWSYCGLATASHRVTARHEDIRGNLNIRMSQSRVICMYCCSYLCHKQQYKKLNK